MSHDDDVPVGRLLSRREVLALLALSSASVIAGCRGAGEAPHTAPGASSARDGGIEVPDCVVRPQQTEGPYFVDERLARSDIRSDPSDGSIRPGVPVELAFHVSRLRSGRCTPLPGARVDLWSCDAAGVYSDVIDRSFDTTGRKFLRGHQVTGAQGIARFTTVYPGWYPGRAVHVHFKIRDDASTGRGLEFVSQLYFDDALTDRVHAAAPYAEHVGQRRRNVDDFIYSDGGARLMLAPAETPDGFAARFDVALEIG